MKFSITDLFSKCEQTALLLCKEVDGFVVIAEVKLQLILLPKKYGNRFSLSNTSKSLSKKFF